MASFRYAAVLLLCCLSGAAAWAQSSARAKAVLQDAELGSLIRLLLEDIETLSEYRANAISPPVFLVPQRVIEAKVCDTPCNVTGAYVPGEGVYVAGNLDPVREPLDRAALLHELVHYLQQGHPKFAGLSPCERAHAKEREAYAIHNAYLAKINRAERVTFYDGDFDCGRAAAPAP